MTGRMLVPCIAVFALLGSFAAEGAAQGQVMLQIGTFPTEAEAQTEFAKLQQFHGSRLGGATERNSLPGSGA